MAIAYTYAVIDKTLTDATYIQGVEKDGRDGLIVTFSDGTTAGYVVEELLTMRPIREPVKVPSKSDCPPND